MYNRWMPDELYHHGVKGMKWGVRKQRLSSGDKYRVLSSLTQKERDQYNGWDMDDQYYQGRKARDRERKRANFYKKEAKLADKDPKRYRERDRFAISLKDKNGDPMGFLLGQEEHGNYINVAIAVTKKYQGKHVSEKLVNEGKKWFDKHPEYSEMRWYAVKSNTRSQKVAEKSGFERAPEYDELDEVVYRYKRKS